MVSVQIIGYIIATCIVFGAFWILILNRIDATTQFISMLLLALVVAVAPGKVVNYFGLKAENQKVAKQLILDRFNIKQLENRLSLVQEKNRKMKKIGSNKIKELNNVIMEEKADQKFLINWIKDFEDNFERIDPAKVVTTASLAGPIGHQGTAKNFYGEKISGSLEDVPIKHVFMFINKVSGKNFEVDENLEDKITLNLEEPTPWDEILSIILKENNLKLVYDGSNARIVRL